MSKLSTVILSCISASILLSSAACTSASKSQDDSERTPATKVEDTDSESDRLHHQKMLNRLDRMGGKRSF